MTLSKLFFFLLARSLFPSRAVRQLRRPAKTRRAVRLLSGLGRKKRLEKQS